MKASAMRVTSLICVLLALSQTATALETTAGADTVNASQVGLSSKIDALNAMLTATINKLLKCNNKHMVFSSDPSATDKDADGCVSAGGDMANSDIELYKDYKTASVAIPDCYEDGKFSNCYASINLKALVPADAQGLQVSFPTNKSSKSSTSFLYTATFDVDTSAASSCQVKSFHGGVSGCPVTGGDGGSYDFAEFNVKNGVGTIRSGEGRWPSAAALGGMLTVKYYVIKGKLVPAGS